jgi:hypothetical protein
VLPGSRDVEIHKPQKGVFAMNQILVERSYITVKELVLVDKEAAHALAEVNPPEKLETVRRALRDGLLLMRDGLISTVVRANSAGGK